MASVNFYRHFILLFSLILFIHTGFSQTDSTKADLSFDLGITRGRNINLWPIFKRYKSTEQKELQILFPIYSQRTIYQPRSKHLHLLPVFIDDSSANGIDRRFISTYYPTLFHYQQQNINDTLIKSYKFLELAPNISCIGLSRSPQGLFVENNLLFFLWYKHDDMLKKTHVIVFPTYWYFANRYDTTQLLLPLFYKKTSLNQEKLNIGLLFQHKKNLEENRNVLFPLFWNRQRYISNDTIVSNTFLPVYWSNRSNTENKKIVFPILYRLKDKRYESLTLFPLFSSGHSTNLNQNHIVVTPLFWHLKNGNSTKNRLFPIWWNSTTILANDTLNKNILFPLYWSTKNSITNNKVLFPLVYSLKDNNTQSFTLFPLFSIGHSVDLSRNYLVLTPLFWHHRNKLELRNTLFPIWWHHSTFYNNDTSTKITLFPFYWSTESKAKTTKVLLPLIYRLKDNNYQSFTVFPLFSAGHSTNLEQQHLVMTPLFWHLKKPGNTRNIVFPVWWNSTYYQKNDTIYKNTLFPIYWSTKGKSSNHKIIFPVVFRLKDSLYQSLTVLPLFSVGHSTDYRLKHLTLLSVYWKWQQGDELHEVLFPFWWKNKAIEHGDTVIKRNFVPLYWSTKSNSCENNILFPFFYRLNNKQYQSLTLIPFFTFGHSTNYNISHIGIAPVYLHLKNDFKTSDIIFPFFWRTKTTLQNDTIIKNTFFPIYWSTQNKSKDNKIIFPFAYILKNQRYHSVTVLPFISIGHSPDLSYRHLVVTPVFWHLKNRRASKDVLFPIWWRSIKNNQNDTTYRTALFPVYWSTKNKLKNNRILFPFAYALKNQNYQSITILPLISMGYSPDLSHRHLVFTPFYWHHKNASKSKDVLFPVWWRSTTNNLNDTVYKTTIFPVYWSRNSNSGNNKIILPFVFSLNNEQYHSFTFFPLFSKGSSSDKHEQYLAVTPFYWLLKNSYSTRERLLPIWWNTTLYENYYTIHYQTFFPIFWSKHSETRNYTMIFPFALQLNNPTYHSLTIFPFFSTGNSINNSSKHLAVTPFFWHLKNDDNTRNILFPVLWVNREKEYHDTTLKIRLLPIYWSKHNKNVDNQVLFPFIFSFRNTQYKSFTLLPLVSFGHSTNSGSQHLMITPISGLFKNDNNKSAFVFPVYFYRKTNSETRSSLLFFLFRNNHRPGYSKTSVLWPLCMRVKSPEVRSFRIAPIIWYKQTDTSKMVSFQPFQYSYKSPTRKTFLFMWFLYKYEQLPDSLLSHSVLWKVYNHDTYTNGDFETRFLYLVYANINKAGKREKSVLPFYHSVSYPNGDKSKSVAFAFYNYFKQYKPEIKEYYEEERIFWFIRLRSNYAKLKSEGKGEYLRRK